MEEWIPPCFFTLSQSSEDTHSHNQTQACSRQVPLCHTGVSFLAKSRPKNACSVPQPQQKGGFLARDKSGPSRSSSKPTKSIINQPTNQPSIHPSSVTSAQASPTSRLPGIVQSPSRSAPDSCRMLVVIVVHPDAEPISRFMFTLTPDETERKKKPGTPMLGDVDKERATVASQPRTALSLDFLFSFFHLYRFLPYPHEYAPRKPEPCVVCVKTNSWRKSRRLA
ncbi:hypothetical protein VTK56DRAFT_1739 [Thermocarpiscus australiensis]